MTIAQHEAADLDRSDPPYRWPPFASLAFIVAVNAAAWGAIVLAVVYG